MLWIGHFDLTASLGIPAQFEHPDYLDAVQQVLDACEKHGKTPGIMAGDVETGKKLLAQGFRDLGVLGRSLDPGQALRQGLAELRAG